MEDHAAIRQSLGAFYRTFLSATDDGRDWDALRSLFSPGGRVRAAHAPRCVIRRRSPGGGRRSTHRPPAQQSVRSPLLRARVRLRYPRGRGYRSGLEPIRVRRVTERGAQHGARARISSFWLAEVLCGGSSAGSIRTTPSPCLIFRRFARTRQLFGLASRDDCLNDSLAVHGPGPISCRLWVSESELGGIPCPNRKIRSDRPRRRRRRSPSRRSGPPRRPRKPTRPRF